ncbi:MAG: hypothetical protein ACHRHE_10070 [Tepidisphaerales bacterium]
MIRTLVTAFLVALLALFIIERLVRNSPQIIVTQAISAQPASLPSTRPVLNLSAITFSLHFNGTHFRPAMAEFQRLSGVRISVEWQVSDSPGINPDHPITLDLQDTTAKRALRLILNQAAGDDQDGLTYEVEGNVVFIRRMSQCKGSVFVRMYNVRDILAGLVRNGPGNYVRRPNGRVISENGSPPPPPIVIAYDAAQATEDLKNLIVETIDVETWVDNGGKTGQVRCLGGLLVVQQTPDNLELIEDLLAKVRDKLK